MSTENFPAGIKVQIAKCKDFPCVVGKWATVCARQDCPGKIKVSFDDQWQGYFAPEQLGKISEPQREMFALIQERDDIAKKLADIQRDLAAVENRIKTIGHKHKLCSICGAPMLRDYCHEDILYRKWACCDRKCHGFIIEE